MLSPASSRMRVRPVASKAALPELPLASTQNLTMPVSLPRLFRIPRTGAKQNGDQMFWSKSSILAAMDLAQIQQELRNQKLDGWLFFDHHLRDPLAYRVLGFTAPRSADAPLVLPDSGRRASRAAWNTASSAA